MVAAAEVGVDEPVGFAPEVRERLVAYVDEIASGLGRVEQRRAAAYYARGLIEEGKRKSLEPVVGRLGGGKVEYEALQHFLADSPWDEEVIERAVAERMCAVIEPEGWVLDDTGVVKDGEHSPGVKRQYSGTLGKTGNCQVTVSLHAVDPRTPITYGTRSTERSDARSAMNSPCPCAAVIIARSTAVAMKLHGGEKLGLIRHSQRACCGSKVTR